MRDMVELQESAQNYVTEVFANNYQYYEDATVTNVRPLVGPVYIVDVQVDKNDTFPCLYIEGEEHVSLFIDAMLMCVLMDKVATQNIEELVEKG